MPNKMYLKGVRKERKLVNEAKARGCIAFRSAGSHSPIDVCVINPQTMCISLVQAKSDKLPKSEQLRLEKRYEGLNGLFRVVFRVM